MIVRISGEGQYRLADDDSQRLGQLENAVVSVVEGGRDSDQKQQRQTERELQIKAQMASELPMEPEMERWFPLWGIPI